MPYARKTLTQLRADMASNIQSSLKSGDGLLRYSNLGILGTILAGMLHMVYGFLDWIAKQAVPSTATDEYLEQWAALKRIVKKGANAATCPAVIFLGAPGKPLPGGTLVARADNYLYMTTADGTVGSDGTVSVPIVAVLPSVDDDPTGGGGAGNSPAGTTLTLRTGVDGIQSTGTAGLISGGADIETNDALRARMLQAYQDPPEGGAEPDYIEWALAVPGVTRVWIARNGFGAGTVVVYFMMDLAQAVNGGFPQGTNGVAALENRDNAATGDQLALANAIYPLQPVTALVYGTAPIATPVAFTISGIATAPQTVKDAISSAIAGVFLRNGEPGGTINLLDIESVISSINGTSGAVITVPTGNIVLAAGHLPTVGVITYV